MNTTPTPASSLGVRDAADVTPAADQSRGSVEGLGRRNARELREREALERDRRAAREAADAGKVICGACESFTAFAEPCCWCSADPAASEVPCACSADLQYDIELATPGGPVMARRPGAARSPDPDCSICRGTGFVEAPGARLYELSVEAPRDRREAADG
jgi:hypothetical protein